MNDHGAVTTIMFDTVDLDASVSFWTALLGLEEVHRTDTYVYLSPMTESGPHLAFQLVPEEKSVKNRLHLDVRVPDRDAALAQIDALGGRSIRHVSEPGFPEWTVVADPLGNEFCVYEKGNP